MTTITDNAKKFLSAIAVICYVAKESGLDKETSCTARLAGLLATILIQCLIAVQFLGRNSEPSVFFGEEARHCSGKLTLPNNRKINAN